LLSNLSFSILILTLFTACSGKSNYTPKGISFEKEKKIPFIFTETKIDRVEHDVVKLSDGSIINRDGKLVSEPLEIKTILKDEVIYSQNKNLIAYVTRDNSIALFDIEQNRTIFKEKFNFIASIDRRLPKPFFDKNSILYFTFDGKIAIYSQKDKKIVKVLSIDNSENYSNVIDYKLSKNSLILLTHKKLMLIKDNYNTQLEIDLRGAIFRKDSFFAITKKGEIREYSYDLIMKRSIKFPFAYFISFGQVKDKLYLIESQGYIIELNENLKNYRVIQSELDDENCFFTNDKFICDEKIFRLPLSI